MSHLIGNLLLFGTVLRRAGIDVHPGRLLDVVAALEFVDLASRAEVYHACRALLVHRPDQIAIFDRAFDLFWSSHSAGAGGIGAPREARLDTARVTEQIEAAAELESIGEGGDGDVDGRADGLKIWSDAPGLAEKDFGTLTAGELAEASEALAQLAWSPGERRTRRWIRGRGPRLDLRRAIAESRRTGGDVVAIARQRRRIRPRPLVLLCDISGSMERYSRMLLRFAHAISTRRRRVEAFLFATRLTRITRQLRAARPDEALAAVSRTVPEWSGGTRIGQAIKEFHQQWAGRVLSGGPVVLLVSDGWDCGDPGELAAQISRLQRRCRRLVWLNPLLGSIGYAPLTRGLQAALPFVDDFLPARTLTNLADLAVHLNSLA
ncbi:MAG TPA: VWA domain-containing protein [Vicinamibacterales bacterium]|nr:VWA domain-containing protein [Vicinamibacterales bacterium]